MRAAIYLRQSKDPDQTGLAVDRQRIDCEKLATERGWTVVRTEVDNDMSASSGRRRDRALPCVRSSEVGSALSADRMRPRGA